MEQITYTNKINVTRNVDVFIAGGGPSGVAAAVFAARMGASVYLVEESGAFGGAAATMLVPMFMQFGDGENFLAAGIGKVEPVEQPPKEIQSGTVGVSPIDPAQALILSGKQVLTGQKIHGDVYITSDGDVNFFGVSVSGNLYVAGKLHASDYLYQEGVKTNVGGYVYAYDFGVTCEVFDGTHGQITGGPIFCKGYVVANDALDYAFDTWGKQ